MKMLYSLFATLLLSLSGVTYADWELDNSQSLLSLVTTKAGNIAEVHSFEKLDGKITGDNVTVRIDLGSIKTNIDIRDERMREMLFETSRFPAATFSTSFKSKALDNLRAGDAQVQDISGKLSLHGEEQPLDISVSITRLTNNRLMVVNRQPIIINAGSFKLVAGVEKLREVAALPSISNAVPVSFVLVFEKK